jgi:hypothetical protein
MFPHCDRRDTVTALPDRARRILFRSWAPEPVICASSGAQRSATEPNTESATVGRSLPVQRQRIRSLPVIDPCHPR